MCAAVFVAPLALLCNSVRVFYGLASRCAVLVLAHQAAEAHHVGGEDGSKLAAGSGVGHERFSGTEGARATIIFSGAGVRKEARARMMENSQLANKILFPCVSGDSKRDLRGSNRGGRAATRGDNYPGDRSFSMGFRLAQD